MDFRWTPVALKEFRAVVTSVGTWLFVPLLFIWGVRPNSLGWESLGPDMSLGFIQLASSTGIPLAVVLLTFRSVVSPRRSGSLKLTLNLPVTRREILVSKGVGRATGVGALIVATSFGVSLYGAIRFGYFSVLRFLLMLLVTLFYGAVLVSVCIAASAASKHLSRVASLIGGGFLLFILWWEILATIIYSTLTGVSVNPRNPPADGLLYLLHRLSPKGAYNVVSNWVLGVGNSSANFSNTLSSIDPTTSINAISAEAAFSGHALPVYLHPVVSLIVLAVWGIIPFVVASRRFSRGDLA